jgi:hypothetical protein
MLERPVPSRSRVPFSGISSKPISVHNYPFTHGKMVVSGEKKTREWPGFEAVPITHLSHLIGRLST